jgi:hypothetical protein
VTGRPRAGERPSSSGVGPEVREQSVAEVTDRPVAAPVARVERLRRVVERHRDAVDAAVDQRLELREQLAMPIALFVREREERKR